MPQDSDHTHSGLRPQKDSALGESPELQALHARYRANFERAPIGIANVALDGRWVMANAALCRILGYTEAELLQTDFQQLTHPDDLAPDLAQARRLVAGEIETYAITKRYRRKDGSYLWANLTGAVVRDRAGRPLEFVATIEDISSTRQTQEELRRARIRIESALTASEVGTYEWDVGRDKLYVDANFLAIQPLTLDADGTASASRVFANVHPEDRDRVAAAVQESVTHGLPYDADYRYITPAGEKWITARGTLRIRPDGRVESLFGTVMDITKRKRAELDRERLAEALREAKDRAEQASQAKDRFLAVLSHELRTPLAPVLSAAQLLHDDEALSPQQFELVQTIRRNAELEARLIDDLLDLTRIARNKLVLSTARVSAHDLLKQVLGICADDIAAKRLVLELRLDAAQDAVFADAARLQQIIWNVVKNAVKFTPPGGHITIHTANDNGLVITVTDTGFGITPELMPHVFDAFEQGGSEVTREFGGLGLGLAISKALIEMHGGTITGMSAGRGQGSTFSIRLPLSPSDASLGPSEPRRARAALHCSVLLVEDHADTRRSMTLLLQRLGCTVVAAACVSEARQRADETEFHLLVSDLGLPDGSGLDVVRHIKAQRAIPAIALSGFGMEDDQQRSRAAGFDAHLVKPVRFDLLVETARRLLGQTSGAST